MTSDASDPAQLARDYGAALVDAVDAVIEEWVIDAVARVAGEALTPVEPELEPEATAAAARDARADIVPRLRELLARDIDDQSTTPLAVLRDAPRYPTAVLRRAGVAPVRRDDDSRSRFPDDDYDLVPAAFADFGPAVAEAGLRWGAAKAFVQQGGVMAADGESDTVRVIAYVPDLMDRSRLAGIEGLVYVSSPADLALADAAVGVAVIDLSRPGALDVLGQVRAARIIGFGSHVDRDLLDAARAAGCHEVMARSAFFAQARQLLG